MKLALVVATAAACNSGARDRPPRESSGDPTLDRVMALRDQVPAGTPRWPAATRWLATDRTFRVAIDHGNELFAATASAIVRVPKDGAPPTVLAELPGTRIDELAVTTRSLVFTAFDSANGVEASKSGGLYAVPLAGGKPTKVRDIGIGDQLATYGPALWLAHDKQILAAKEPELAKMTVTDKAHYSDAIAADARGVWWLEAEYDKVKMNDGDWVNAPGRRTQVPLRFIIHVLYGDGKRLLVLGSPSKATTTTAKVAPGGGTYYESSNAIFAIDDAGAMQALSEPLGEVWGFAVGGDAICAIDDGPKLDFGKSEKLFVLAADGSKRMTTLATGLDHAEVLAADARSCYVVLAHRPGIAVVPITGS